MAYAMLASLLTLAERAHASCSSLLTAAQLTRLAMHIHRVT